MEIITQNAQETQKLGEKIGLDLNSGKIGLRILCLYGDLGSGKTTFLQGLARGLGVKRRVVSPTFVFMKQYKNLSPVTTEPCFSNNSFFYHVDLYRINNVKEAKGLGLEEVFKDSKAIVAIEWAERIKEILPKKRTDIYFDYVSENQRKITF